MSVPVVLIPGAGGQAWVWHLVEADLRQRGYDAFAVDLPAADESKGLPAYADAVVSAIGDRANSDTPVTIAAYSLGAFKDGHPISREMRDLFREQPPGLFPDPFEPAGEGSFVSFAVTPPLLRVWPLPGHNVRLDGNFSFTSSGRPSPGLWGPCAYRARSLSAR